MWKYLFSGCWASKKILGVPNLNIKGYLFLLVNMASHYQVCKVYTSGVKLSHAPARTVCVGHRTNRSLPGPSPPHRHPTHIEAPIGPFYICPRGAIPPWNTSCFWLPSKTGQEDPETRTRTRWRQKPRCWAPGELWQLEGSGIGCRLGEAHP